MKKRWLWMALVGVLGVASITLVGGSEPVEVTTAVLSAGRVEQTVTCTGVVESAKATGVFLPVSCVMKQVLVKEGDRVKQGDVVALMDKQATLEAYGNDQMRMQLAAMEEKLTAPGNGVVMAVNALEGASLEKGTPCVLLALEKDLQVRVGLREKDLQSIRQGMEVRMSGDGFAQAEYTGQLIEIAAAARTDTGSGTVVEGIVRLDEGQLDSSLRFGLSARVTVVTSVTDHGVLVPHEAVLSDDRGEYVYLLESGCARRHYLEISGQVASGILLSDGSLEGKTVICQPGKIEQDGMAVEEAKG